MSRWASRINTFTITQASWASKNSWAGFASWVHKGSDASQASWSTRNRRADELKWKSFSSNASWVSCASLYSASLYGK